MGTPEIAEGGEVAMLLNGLVKAFCISFLVFFFSFEEGRVNCQTLNIYRFHYNSLLNAVRTFPDDVKQFRPIQPSEDGWDSSPEEILLCRAPSTPLM